MQVRMQAGATSERSCCEILFWIMCGPPLRFVKESLFLYCGVSFLPKAYLKQTFKIVFLRLLRSFFFLSLNKQFLSLVLVFFFLLVKGGPSWTCIVAQELWAHLPSIYYQFLKNQKEAGVGEGEVGVEGWRGVGGGGGVWGKRGKHGRGCWRRLVWLFQGGVLLRTLAPHFAWFSLSRENPCMALPPWGPLMSLLALFSWMHDPHWSYPIWSWYICDLLSLYLARLESCVPALFGESYFQEGRGPVGAGVGGWGG